MACSSKACRELLPVPGANPADQGAEAARRNDRDLAVLVRFGVVLLHRCFMRSEFALNLCALIARCARKVFLRVIQLVGVELQLGFGNFQVGVVA